MALSVKVIAFGFAALLVALGVLLLLAGYNLPVQNASEVNSGWTLVVIGVAIWGIGFISRFLR